MRRVDALVEKYDLPYWLHSSWWDYVLGPSRYSYPYTSDWRVIDRWNVIRCRWRGHPAGVHFYNPGGLEPDMTCRGCGDDLG